MTAKQTTDGTMTRSPDVGEEGSPGLSLRDVIVALRAHKWFMLLCALFCVFCCAIYLKIRPPLYSSSATLRIDPSRAGSLGVTDGQTGAPIDESDVIQTEVGVIRSNKVAVRVLDSLSPEQLYEVTGYQLGSSPKLSTSDVLAQEQAKWIRALELKTTVTPTQGTELVTVSFVDKDPKLAALVVDRILNAYEAQSLASRNDSVAQLKTWLTGEITSLKSQVNKSQDNLARFEESNNILATDRSSNTTLDRLRLLNDRLTQAQAEQIVKEGALRAARAGSPESLAALFPNPRLTQLQTQQAELYNRYAQLSAKFDYDYPPLVEVQKQMKMINSELSTSAQAVVNRLQQEYDAAKYVQQTLRGQYQEQMATAYQLNRNEAEYAVLQAQVTSGRELLNALQSKLQQAVVDAEVTGVNVVVVDSAAVPTNPAGPKASILLAGALFLGLFAAAAAVFVFEATSARVQSVPQVKQALGVPVLACIPRRPQRHKPELAPSVGLALSGGPVMCEADAYRAVRNRLLLISDETHKIVLVAGVSEVEESAHAAMNTAAALARAGFRALLVDANLRNPTLRRYVEAKNGAALTDASHAPALRPTIRNVEHLNNVSYVSTTERGAHASDDLASNSFLMMLRRWSADFDYVIVNGEAFWESSDSLLLAKRVDTVLLVSRYQKTRLSVLLEVKNMLDEIGAVVGGVLIDDVPLGNRSLLHES